MKFLMPTMSMVLLALNGNAAKADMDFPDYNSVLESFYTQGGNLKLADGTIVVKQFADDTIQHFSGSEGNRIRIECDAPATNTPNIATCDIVVTILYGHHGEENGAKDIATYKVVVQQQAGGTKITAVTRTLVSKP